MKNKQIIIVVLAVLVVGGYYFYSKDNNNISKVTSEKDKTEIILNDEIKEITLSPADIDSYKLTLKSKGIIHLRHIIDNYKNGKTSEIDIPLRSIIVSSSTNTGRMCGFDSFDKNYFRSKFFVMAVEGSLGGGDSVTIVFINKPDKAFSAWLYPTSKDSWELRSFCENIKLSKLDIENEFLIPLKLYLQDPSFSI